MPDEIFRGRDPQLAIPRHDDDERVRQDLTPALWDDETAALEVVHLQLVGGDENVRRRAFLNLTRQDARSAEVENDFVAVVRGDLLQHVSETGGSGDVEGERREQGKYHEILRRLAMARLVRMTAATAAVTCWTSSSGTPHSSASCPVSRR